MSSTSHFLNTQSLQTFANHIIRIIYGGDNTSNDLAESDHIVYQQNLDDHGIIEIGKDMDILLGFTTISTTPITITLFIADNEIAKKQVCKDEFVSALETGECLPLSSLENYKVYCKVEPEGAPLSCMIGRLCNVISRIKVKLNPWKYICFHKQFFILRCADVEIRSIKHIRDFEHIPALPNIQTYVDQEFEEWKKQKNSAFISNMLEEFIARTWHPSRHIDWCLDNDDKEMLGFAAEH